jgi:hypothetical protein
MKTKGPDLTQRPPRSPRVRLGGYAILPRVLDKARATLIGKNGEFHFNCPLDQHFFDFAGIDSLKLKEELASGKGDWDILQWIKSSSTTQPSTIDILAWSAYQDQRGPSDIESREAFNDYHAKLGAYREDISSWFDVLDLDDFVTFGPKIRRSATVFRSEPNQPQRIVWNYALNFINDRCICHVLRLVAATQPRSVL